MRKHWIPGALLPNYRAPGHKARRGNGGGGGQEPGWTQVADSLSVVAAPVGLASYLNCTAGVGFVCPGQMKTVHVQHD